MWGTERRRSNDFGSLFESRGGLGSGQAGNVATYDELVDRLHRAEADKERVERAMETTLAGMERANARLRAENDSLTRSVDRLKSEAEETAQLKSRFEETFRYSRELEARCDELTARSETDANALKKRNRELEEQVVELLERASNEHRTRQAAEEKIRAEMEAHKRKLEIEYEQKIRVAEIHWKKEQRILENELERLRQELAARPKSLMDRLRNW